MSDPRIRRPRVVLVPDPSTDPGLTTYACDFLAYGTVGVAMQPSIDLLGDLIGAEHIDLVIVLRSAHTQAPNC